MCIVIDINTLSIVLNRENVRHNHFAPVRDWIMDGPGHIVYGGTKYKGELARMTQYHRVVNELKTARKAREIEGDEVDRRENEIIDLTRGTDCNDQHIVAILCVSGCKLFCTDDTRAIPYVKNRSLYYPGQERRRIYRTAARNKELLDRRYIVPLQHEV